jgi:hypothetical protein
MNGNAFRQVAAVLAGAIFSLFSAGCSAFQSSRQIDMNPFAENTSAMFAEAAKAGRPFNWNHLKPYMGIPELPQMRAKSEPLIRGLRGIVMYSNQLVALNMSSKTDKEKNRLLAAYFRDVAGKIADRSGFDSIGVNPNMMDTLYINIERAEAFREGIDAASPLVNAVVLAMLRRIDEIDAVVPPAVNAIDRLVETEYADKRRNYRELMRLQTSFQYSATLLYDGKTGNREAFGKLLEADPSMREFFASADKPTAKEFAAAESELAGRLERIDTFLRQLDGEKAAYIAKQQELESLRQNVDERLKVARDAIILWAQSHRNLGAGIAVPPLIDVGGIAGGLARKVVPLP